MTGKDLINYIHKYNLEDSEILRLNDENLEDGDFLKFAITDKKELQGVDYKILWLHDDYYQDVIFNHEGDLTYGVNKRTKRLASIYLNTRFGLTKR